MPKVDPLKLIQRRHSKDEMQAALHALVNGTEQRTMPPQTDDSDIVMSDCIEELIQLRGKIAELEAFMRQWLAKPSNQR